jgi:hypothetical protein
MKHTFFFSSALAFGLAAGCSAQTPTAPSAQKTASEIRTESIRKNNDPVGHALPLLASWNPGSYPRAQNFDPAYQISLIEKGHHLIPGFAFPNIPADAAAGEAAIEKSREYYEAPLQRAAQLQLPITLIGTQWEQVLYANPKYFELPAAENPNVVTPDGKIEKKISPFGPVELWREVGAQWGSSPLMQQIQKWYPNPPQVILLSNNEAGKLRWHEIEQDARYLEKYGAGRDDDFKRKVVADAWIERYRALQDGMRAALSASWRDKVLFVGYDAFGGAAFARWPGWINYSTTTPGQIAPDPLMWDGNTSSYYTASYNGLTDYRVMSPQIESMNWIFMQKQALKLNPNFRFGFSVWNGYTEKKETDRPAFYENLGQEYSPARYGGYAQFGLWLLRPRVLREYRGYNSRGWAETTEQIEPWFMALAADIDRIYENKTLQEFWRKGELVPNRAHPHPYQVNVPEEYKNEDRWFLLDTNLDPPRPWKLETELPVFSLALVEGEKGNRRWLVHAYSPVGARKDVEITIPEYGKIKADATVAGAFYVVDEKAKTVTPVH